MTDDYVERLWRGYRDKVLPRNAPKVQIVECKRAFFGGALSLLNAITGDLDEDDDPTDRDMERMASIHRELVRFGETSHFHHGTKGNA